MRIDDWAFLEHPEVERAWLARLVHHIASHLDGIARALNGGLTFGNGVDPDNFRGEWKSFSSTTSPGNEITVAHTLGLIPVGFLTLVPPTEGFIVKGPTAWTSQNIYLKITAASQTATIFILAPPESS